MIRPTVVRARETRAPTAHAVRPHAHRMLLELRLLVCGQQGQDFLPRRPVLKQQLKLRGGGLVMKRLEGLGVGGWVRHGLDQGFVGRVRRFALGLEGRLVILVDGLHLGLLSLCEVQALEKMTLTGGTTTWTKAGALSGKG